METLYEILEERTAEYSHEMGIQHDPGEFKDCKHQDCIDARSFLAGIRCTVNDFERKYKQAVEDLVYIANIWVRDDEVDDLKDYLGNRYNEYFREYLYDDLEGISK